MKLSHEEKGRLLESRVLIEVERAFGFDSNGVYRRSNDTQALTALRRALKKLEEFERPASTSAGQ